jgi:hypothetical protein
MWYNALVSRSRYEAENPTTPIVEGPLHPCTYVRGPRKIQPSPHRRRKIRINELDPAANGPPSSPPKATLIVPPEGGLNTMNCEEDAARADA